MSGLNVLLQEETEIRKWEKERRESIDHRCFWVQTVSFLALSVSWSGYPTCCHHVQRYTRSFPGDSGGQPRCLQHGWEKNLSRTSLCLTNCPLPSLPSQPRLSQDTNTSIPLHDEAVDNKCITPCESGTTHSRQHSSKAGCASCHIFCCIKNNDCTLLQIKN